VLQAQVMAGLSTVMNVFQLSQPAMDKDGTNAPFKNSRGQLVCAVFQQTPPGPGHRGWYINSGPVRPLLNNFGPTL